MAPQRYLRPHRHRPALFGAYPQLVGRIPWLELVMAPTPVHPFEAASRETGCEVWVKRDDRTHPGYGGNKVRKLEFLLGAAQARSARALLTVGARGSHHVLCTAVHGRALNLEVVGVTYPRPVTEGVLRTEAATRATGARLRETSSYAGVPGELWRAWQALRVAPGAPYFIAAGGSSPRGALGYVDAGLELAAQVAAGELPAPDSVVVPYGSGGTVAGLLLGLRMGGLGTRLVAVRVVPWLVSTRTALFALASATRTMLVHHGVPRRFGAKVRVQVQICGEQLGAGYGHETEAARRAVELAAGEGLPLETTYSGKALAALLALGARGELGRRILFWETYSPLPGAAG